MTDDTISISAPMRSIVPMMQASALGLLLWIVATIPAQVSRAGDGDEPRGWFMDVQRYHPTFDTLGGFQVESSRVLDLWQPAFGLHFNYANRPLSQFEIVDGLRQVVNAPVNDLFAMDLQAAVGLRYADVAIVVPVTLAMKSSSDAVYGLPHLSEPYAGVGDIRFALKGALIDSRNHPVGLALLLPVSLPTGNAYVYNGTWGASFAPQLIVETSQLAGKLHAAVNVGPSLTSSVVYESVDGHEILRSGPELRLSVNVGYRVAEPVDLNGEIVSAFGLGGEPAATRNPVELRIGARLYPKEWLSLDIALGTGLSPGVGSPVFRLVFGASFTPDLARDSDGDGLRNRDDACPDDPEDLDGFVDGDGCPDLDNDRDGVADSEDRCPGSPESPNSYHDEDGCPDLANSSAQCLPPASLQISSVRSLVPEGDSIAPGDCYWLEVEVLNSGAGAARDVWLEFEFAGGSTSGLEFEPPSNVPLLAPGESTRLRFPFCVAVDAFVGRRSGRFAARDACGSPTLRAQIELDVRTLTDVE